MAEAASNLRGVGVRVDGRGRFVVLCWRFRDEVDLGSQRFVEDSSSLYRMILLWVNLNLTDTSTIRRKLLATLFTLLCVNIYRNRQELVLFTDCCVKPLCERCMPNRRVSRFTVLVVLPEYSPDLKTLGAPGLNAGIDTGIDIGIDISAHCRHYLGGLYRQSGRQHFTSDQ